MFQAETTLRVRYAETDQMGYVYYGNYAMYFEVGRVEALRQAGFSYKQMEENGVIMPVLENQTKYLRPGKYDELLTIKTTIPEMPGIRIKFTYEVYNEAAELITEGSTILTFLKKDTHKPSRPPQFLLDLIRPYFE
ncbi:thioesterase [Rhodonellum psychrophilum GCM71 = DSM 17998]|uniref:Thioesterase n=2 Tax=Rhodonellum TaxID=336827 RepID=U5C2D1_9BACT|nr:MULTISPECIES: thioesterase family protein [Rhodonellum]ERM83081.1 thioesterase [Rhodonellum psychrophilum GCM71 = DSM 17998]MDO9554947.1 thioesterase family protein [Rhodonellum sp.]SDZ47051.1 acyl-CoA thioester hydrolase [Rhodonellum ikkaensis]